MGFFGRSPNPITSFIATIAEKVKTISKLLKPGVFHFQIIMFRVILAITPQLELEGVERGLARGALHVVYGGGGR